MLAYHNDPKIKTAILRQLKKHHDADEIVKGQYWQNGKGCAVGCTIYSSNYAEYETRFGIPQMLARFEDTIFEGVPNAEAKEWPQQFMKAISHGADLSLVGWKFLYWLLTDEAVNPGINHPLVKDAVKQCADILVPLTKGLPADKSTAGSAASAARSAARSVVESVAESAARRAAGSAAESAASAAESAWSVWSAASAAESAADGAESARSAVWSAADGVERAAGSAAGSAASAAESAAYSKMAAKLIDLLKDAPLPAADEAALSQPKAGE